MFVKRLHAVTGDPGALAFWSVHWILVGEGCLGLFDVGRPLVGGWDLVSASRVPALEPDELQIAALCSRLGAC